MAYLTMGFVPQDGSHHIFIDSGWGGPAGEGPLLFPAVMHPTCVHSQLSVLDTVILPQWVNKKLWAQHILTGRKHLQIKFSS